VIKLANGVMYFPSTQQITDPSVAAAISANGLNGNFTNKAITENAKGNLLLVEPAPGQNCSLGRKWIEVPGYFNSDTNLIKRAKIAET
jgi:hypothetical protein